MEEMQNQDAPKMSSIEEAEEQELTHTDKLVGIFTEPTKTFEKIAKYPAKATDWFIPLAILTIVSILSVIVMFSNPQIALEMKQKQSEEIQKLVDEGTLTQERADQQIEMTEQFMSGPFMIVIAAIQVVFGLFIFFFIASAVFMLFVKLVLKGEGTYKDAMVAYGLPFYISVIQGIVIVIASLVLGKMFRSTSVAAFMDLDKASFLHFALNKLDIFSIWFYIVISISFAKMFKSNDTKKYMMVVFGIWIGFSLIIFLISKAFPFLQNFNG